MPEVVRGSRASVQIDRNRVDGDEPPPSPAAVPLPASPIASPTSERRAVHFGPESPGLIESQSHPLSTVDSGISHQSAQSNTSQTGRRKSSERRRERDKSERDAYYDSRAATRREFKRRASTLEEYYKENPELLPQLPFTWRHGWRRWKLILTIFLMVVDACVIPIVLYYTMKFAGHVEGWLIFAVVATIWGGPTYVEFAVRSWRLIKKEDFYRPLGTSNRWAFDITHWIFVLTITAVTALLIVGSAPHIVWLRVLSMPGPAILYCLGGSILVLSIYCHTGARAPFRISSTPKGGEVKPGIYYIIEDIISVNANAGRPFREALAARYDASPRFRRMMRVQSLFWSIPSIIVAIACTVVIVIHPISKEVGYGVGWGVPFVWAGAWAAITVPWVRHEMHKERRTWEEDYKITPKGEKPPIEPNPEGHVPLAKEKAMIPEQSS